MSITFVGSNTGQIIGSGTITVPLPATIQNDMVVVVIGTLDRVNGGVPSTSGYTWFVDVLPTPPTAMRLDVFYKFMGAIPDTTVAIPTSANTCVCVLAFRGVSTATPLDVAATTYFSSPAVANPPSITPVSNDCCIVIAGMTLNRDTSVGSVSGYLPSPAVQVTTTADTTVAAAYRILSGVAAEDPLAWSTWGGSTTAIAATIALRPLTASVEFVTVNQATVIAAGKSVVALETVPVLKTVAVISGKVITVPDARVESIFIDSVDITWVGKTVEPADTVRAVIVTKASVLYRGRAVTPREIQFEDIPRYAIKGRGSGHWMETR